MVTPGGLEIVLCPTLVSCRSVPFSHFNIFKHLLPSVIRKILDLETCTHYFNNTRTHQVELLFVNNFLPTTYYLSYNVSLEFFILSLPAMSMVSFPDFLSINFRRLLITCNVSGFPST